ncbi:MAG: stage III sporulation AC/AD family protein [Clostridia bacterium]|nr:stage III sporulation AC/AD family protein [Clostridia bacterium]
MNILLKITILSLVFVLLSVLLKNYRPEYVFLLRIFAITAIIYFALEYVEKFINSFSSVFSSFNIDSSHISLLIKIVGIAIITDFIYDILIDNGEIAMANTITIFSKFIVLYLTFPVLNGIIAFCLKIIE